MRLKTRIVLFLIVIVYSSSAFAYSREIRAPELIEKPKSMSKIWQLYETFHSHRYYMRNEPVKSFGNYKKRDSAFIAVSFQKTLFGEEFSHIEFNNGYESRKKDKLIVTIDGKVYDEFFFDYETYYPIDYKASQRIISAISSGKEMIVEGISQRGTKIKDIYAIEGYLENRNFLFDKYKDESVPYYQGKYALSIENNFITYVYGGEKKNCFIEGIADKEEGKYKSRGDVYITVFRGKVYFEMGYPLSENIKISIDGKQIPYDIEPFDLYSYNAVIKDEKDNEDFINNYLIGGKEMIIEGISLNKNKTKDTYSLKSFNKMYNVLISKKCRK